MDRDAVIKGLEIHLKGNSRCKGCPYPNNGLCGDQLMADALAMLKAQEPRVLTLEEVEQHDNQNGCVWLERRAYKYNTVAVFCWQDGTDTMMISPYTRDEPVNLWYKNNSIYNRTWRCWNIRPTDEQREATPWN